MADSQAQLTACAASPSQPESALSNIPNKSELSTPSPPSTSNSSGQQSLQQYAQLTKRSAGRSLKHSDALDIKSTSPAKYWPTNYDPFKDRTSTRLWGLKTAPTFRPTAAEWKDPLKYIESIRPNAEEFGLCKIVPPESWNPPFALDSQTFRFETRIQRLNSMEGSTRTVVNYLDQLERFHQQMGTPFNRAPMLDKKPLDLHKLKKEVLARGGYQKVTANKKWFEVGRAIGADKNCTSASYTCRQAFLKWILPYEEFVRANGKMKTERQYAHRELVNPSGRMTRMTALETRGTSSTCQDPAHIESSEMKHKLVRMDLKEDRSPLTILCQCAACGYDALTATIVCDLCDEIFHVACLKAANPPLSFSEWTCADCLKTYGDDFGFEEGEMRSLPQFQKMSDAFKEAWFSTKLPRDTDGRLVITEDDMEKEFWRVVESPFENVEVEYGADLHSSHHGSGFPVVEKDPLNPYSTCAWNLNNMPHLPSSLFCHIRNDISGMTIPWLYVGMTFSTFCWHTEDHYTYSVNYQHWGDTKTWYGVPASDANKFEAAMKKRFPELFRTNPDLLFHLTTTISPGYLKENLVDVCALDQHAGEFVITFPRAYHAGFNQGFNLNEAVNFALPDWLPYGLSCIERYHRFHKKPVFSQDELLIATSTKDTSIKTAIWLKAGIDDLVAREKKGRTILREKYAGYITEEIWTPRNDVFCSVCKFFLHCSALYLHCSERIAVCFDHSESLLSICKCEPAKLVFRVRYTDLQLEEIAAKVSRSANRPVDWLNRYTSVMLENRRPSLHVLESLLLEADQIPCFIPEAASLRSFVSTARDWVARAKSLLAVVENGGNPSDLDSVNGSTMAKPQVLNVSAIVDLLSEANELPFDTPELSALRSEYEKLALIRRRVQSILQSSDELTAEALLVELTALSSEAFDVPERKLIEDAIYDLRWIEKAQSIVQDPKVDHETVVQAVFSGRSQGAVPDPAMTLLVGLKKRKAQTMAELKKKKAKGDTWKLEAIALLKQKGISFADAVALIDRVNDCPVVDELYKKLEAGVQTARSLIDRGRQLLREDGHSLKLNLTDAYSFIAALETLNIPIRVDEAIRVKRETERIEDWLSKAPSRLVGRQSQRAFWEVLMELSRQAKICQGSLTGSFHCFCRTGEDGGMILCDICNEWYHHRCLRMTKNEAKCQSEFVCPICDPAVMHSNIFKKVPLDVLSNLFAESSSFAFEVDETKSLDILRSDIANLHNHIQDVLSNPSTSQNLSTLRDLLRAIEGYPIALNDDVVSCLRRRVLELMPAQRDKSRRASGEARCLCGALCDASRPGVECHRCHASFHMKCVGQVEALTTYTCAECSKNPTDTAAPLSKQTSLKDETAAPRKIKLKLHRRDSTAVEGEKRGAEESGDNAVAAKKLKSE
ncbi:hypothetical protein DFJ73DRAFT_623678 [Zopfochytrium polystomum]|nr:hypothetical protein DFJ73DRAFT_623678 [Zopfochytrium polystomum]